MSYEIRDIPTTKTFADIADTDLFEGQNAVGGALSSFKIAKSDLTPLASETAKGNVEEATDAEMPSASGGGGTGAGATLARLFVNPVKLGTYITAFLAAAHTWALQQIFTVAPRFSSVTASEFLTVDSNKDLASVAAATQAEMITGTDNTKVATPKSVEDKGSVKLRQVSNNATGTTNIDCQSQDTVHVEFTTAITGAAEFTVSNASNLQSLNVTFPVTGSNIAITVPSTTRMARYHEVASGPGWNQSSKILTVSAVGTADLFEFSFKRSNVGATVFLLTYDGPARA